MSIVQLNFLLSHASFLTLPKSICYTWWEDWVDRVLECCGDEREVPDETRQLYSQLAR
jgi:hypothetical protein